MAKKKSFENDFSKDKKMNTNKNSKKIINKKGASLILTLVVIALISILSTLTLSLALNAYKNSVQNKWADEDFYYCEETLDELYRVIVHETNDVYTTSYKTAVSLFSMDDPEAINTMFQENVTLGLESIKQMFSNNRFNKDIEDGSAEKRIIGSIVVTYNDKETKAISNNTKYLFKDVCVKYLNKNRANGNNFYASITTDIVIDIPVLSKTISESGYGALNYIWISGKNITVQNNTSATGNIYAGGDFIINKPAVGITDLKLFSDYITVRNAIKNNGSLSITGSTKTSSIWCTDFLLPAGGDGSTSIISGNMYVNDDLEVNADNCTVQLNGKYYGYGDGTTNTNNNATSNHAGNSAIVINGKGTKLDMSSVSELLLNGHSFFPVATTATPTDNDYQQAESLAVIVSQSLYMVDDAYIDFGGNQVKIGTKSKAFSEINVKLGNTTETLASLLGKGYVLVTGGVNFGSAGIDGITANIFASDYIINDSKGSFVTLGCYTVGGKNYCTLYWNLNYNEKNGIIPGEDFIDKCLKKGLADGYLDKFMDGGYITISEGATVNSNAPLYQYKPGEGGYSASLLDKENSTELLDPKNISLTYKFLLNSLTPENYDDINNVTGTSPTDVSIFNEDLLNFKVINDHFTSDTGSTVVYSGTYKNFIVKGDLVIEEDNNLTIVAGDGTSHKIGNGILFVNGDVTIKDPNFNFRGLIIASGNITIEAGKSFVYDADIVKECLKVLRNDHNVGTWGDLVSEAFYKNQTSTEAGSTSLNAADCIRYENWTKNRENFTND